MYIRNLKQLKSIYTSWLKEGSISLNIPLAGINLKIKCLIEVKGGEKSFSSWSPPFKNVHFLMFIWIKSRSLFCFSHDMCLAESLVLSTINACHFLCARDVLRYCTGNSFSSLILLPALRTLMILDHLLKKVILVCFSFWFYSTF